MNRTVRQALMIVAALFLASAAQFGSAQDAQDIQNANSDNSRTATYRVMGLFAPDRQGAFRAAVAQMADVKLVSIDFAAGEATLSFDPAVALPGAKPEQFLERLSQNLRKAPGSTFSLHPRLEIPREQRQHIKIAVAGLDCQGCCLGAYEIVAKLEGVAQATASFKAGLITATIDTSKVTQAAIESALEAKGVTVVKP